jgi:hypothetical protein
MLRDLPNNVVGAICGSVGAVKDIEPIFWIPELESLKHLTADIRFFVIGGNQNCDGWLVTRLSSWFPKEKRDDPEQSGISNIGVNQHHSGSAPEDESGYFETAK